METFTQRCRFSEVPKPRTRFTAGIKLYLTLTALSALLLNNLYAQSNNCNYDVTLVSRVYNSATNQTTFTWSVVNPNPGNGDNGTMQALSHWGFMMPNCPPGSPQIQFVSGQISSNANFPTGGQTQNFSPSIAEDRSQNCMTGPVLKFDAGTNGTNPTYYRVTVQGNYNSGTVDAYFKSGSRTGCCTKQVQGIGCPVICPGTLLVANNIVATPTANSINLGINVSGGATPYTYSWSVVGGGATINNPTSATPTATITDNSLSSITFRVVVTDANNCSVTRQTTILRSQICVINPPTIDNSTATRCGPGEVTLRALCTGGQTNWYSAQTGGTLLLANSTTYSPTVNTTTTFWAECVNPGTGCVSERVAVVATVNALPQLNITASPAATVCVGTNVTLSAAATGFTLTNVVWTSANAQVQAAISGNVLNTSGLSAGTYRINVSATANGCPVTGFIDIVVNATPTATIAYNGGPFCPVGTVAVTRTGTAGGTYSSTAGLMINSTTGEINLATSTPGTYTVTYSFSANGCAGTATTQVVINAIPAATIAYVGGPFCPIGTVNVSIAGQTGGTFSSTAGLSINSTTGAINLAASTPGTYTVTYNFSANGCNNSTTTQVVINAAPTATISYAGGPFCPVGTVSVTRTGTAGGTYTSTAGLSINSTTGAINLAASTPGTYTVTYSFSANGCAGVATTTVVINANPTATIVYNGGPFCPVGTVAVTRTGTAGGTYSSTAGLMINSTTGEINLATSTPGTYTVTYSFSANGCAGTATTTVVINPRPTATISYGGPFCPIGTAAVTLTGQTGGTFSSTAGLNINASTGLINLAASTPGTYTVTYSFSANGCNNTTTATVVINPIPTATIIYAGGPFCPVGMAEVTRTGTAGGTYTSTAGLSINANTGAINLAASTPGTYTVTYSFSANGCNNTTTATVVINPNPTATISYAGGPFCPAGMAEVTRTGAAGGTYTSTAGLSINANTGAINLAASMPGTYTVTYSFSVNGCAGMATTTVVINATPGVPSVTSVQRCGPGQVTLTATGCANGTIRWYENQSGGSPVATGGSYTVNVTTSRVFYVSCVINGCESARVPVTVNILPAPNTTYTLTGGAYCVGGQGVEVILSGSQIGFSYQLVRDGMNVGNPVQGTGNAINFGFQTVAGTYTVIAVTSNGDVCMNPCVATIGSATVVVNPIPTATISYGGPFCPVGMAEVTRTGTAGGTYTSTAGLSINANTGAINLAASTPGTYTVTYSFSVNGCNNSTTTTVVINPIPTATISYGGPFCPVGMAEVTRTGTAGGTYTSTAGLSINANTGAINLAASTPGTYTVTYSFSANGCNNTATAQVVINANPTATISYAGGPFCPVGTVAVTRTGTAGGTYSSTAGLMINSTTGEINLATSTPGTYTVTYSFSANGCAGMATTTVVINPNPSATISYGGPFCPVGTANVTITGQTGGTFSSTAGLSINSTTGAINLAASTPGTYTVTYNFSANGCAGVATTTVLINAIPTATISYGGPFCPVGTAAVNRTGVAGGTYSSTAGLMINSTTGEINLATSTPGTYTVTYSFSLNGCANTATATVVINPTPTATISYGGPFCPVGTAAVTRTGTAGGTYTSAAGLNINASTGLINLAASTPGTYTVTYSFSVNGCAGMATTQVVINPIPTATISYGGPFCPVGTANVTITGQTGGTFSSTAGLSINASTGAINLGASTPGTYTVTYNFSANGCNNSTTTQVVINPNPSATNVTYTLCPTVLNGNTAVFNLNSQIAAIGGTGLTVNFYTTMAAANAGAPGTNIANPGAYTSGNATIYARLQTAAGCFSVAQITLVVTQPTCSITGPTLLCVGQQATYTAPVGATNITWTVMSSNCDIVSGSNAPQLIVRATAAGQATIRMNAIVNGCPVQCEIVVNVNPGPTANRVDYSLCPTTQGGNTAVFNLTLPELQNMITGGVAGVSITGFYTSFDAAAAGTAGTQIANPGAYTSNTTTIYARVQSTAGCVSIAYVNLIVRNVVITPGARSADDCSARITVASTSTARANQSGEEGSLNVTASPNPFNDRIRFNIQSDFSGQGTLDVYNTIGAKIKTVFQGPVVAGQNQTVEFAVPPTQRVNLIYVMTVGNRQVTGKLINIR